MRKGDLTLAILEIIENLACGVADMADTMTSWRNESYAKLRGWKPADPNAKRVIRNFINDIKDGVVSKQRLYERFSQLKKDGIIIETRGKNKRLFSLTSRGEEKLHFLELRSSYLPSYKSERSDQFVIVAFDVPEKERWKRSWLRSALKNIGLSFLQQSLWIGKVKLPQEFIGDMERLHISDYVEIFAVTKTGTIKKLT